MNNLLQAGPWLLLIDVPLLLLFLNAVKWGNRHRRRYRLDEARGLNYVKRILEQLITTTTDNSNNIVENKGRRLIPINDLMEGLSPNTIIHDRLALIKRMRESLVKINVNTLQELTMARESKQKGLHLPAFAANLSMMIGLLGNVLGLCIMVYQMGLELPKNTSAITMDSLTESTKHIHGILAGMNIGLIPTMTGLLSAIVLSLLNHSLAYAQSFFIDDLDRFTIEQLLPSTVPATEDESLLERVSLQLEESFGQLQQISQDNQETIKELNSIQDVFLQIVKNIRESTKTEVSERLLELIGRFSAVNQAVVNYTDSLPKFSQEFKDVCAANTGRTDKLISLYEEQRSLFHWPWHIKAVFSCMAILNLTLLGIVLFR